MKTKINNPRNQRSKLKIQGGFSLVELVFAIFFITIIVFGVINLQSSNLAMINSQNHEIQAHFLANQGLMITESIGATGILSSSNDQYLDTVNYTLNTSTPEVIDGIYTRSIKVEDAIPATTYAYKLTAKVGWEDSTGSHSVSANRIIFLTP